MEEMPAWEEDGAIPLDGALDDRSVDDEDAMDAEEGREPPELCTTDEAFDPALLPVPEVALPLLDEEPWSSTGLGTQATVRAAVAVMVIHGSRRMCALYRRWSPAQGV